MALAFRATTRATPTAPIISGVRRLVRGFPLRAIPTVTRSRR